MKNLDVNGEQLMTVLFIIVALSFFLERALSILFESRFFMDRYSKKSLKELIAFILGALICWQWKFDAISLILGSDSTSVYGSIITGAVIAGGSKGSLKLFHDVLGVSSKREKESRDKAKGNEQAKNDDSGESTNH